MRALWRVSAPLVLAAALAGCGYIGDPLPPALHIPVAINDLAAQQIGDTVRLHFTIPALTTEQLPVKDVRVDLRAGRFTSAFEPGDAVTVTATEPGAVDATATIPAAWHGQEVVFAVRLENSRGKFSAWSNLVSVPVIAPVATPAGLRAEPTPGGVRLSWDRPAAGVGIRWIVYRDGGEAATVDEPAYLDPATEPGPSHRYTVEATHGPARSLPAPEITAAWEDRFAPAAPRGLNVIASGTALELGWDRNTEADLRIYRVYRDGQLLADAVETPAFSDRTVQSGKTYRYHVTAVDLRGNESAPSPSVEIPAP